MAAPSGSGGGIQFQFSGDLTQLKADLQKAAKLAQQYTNETNRATGKAAAHQATFFEQPRLRGERKVARAAKNFARSFGTIGSGADAASSALQALESSFNIGFGATVAATAGIAVFDAWTKEIEATKKAHEALKVELSKPIAVIGGLSVSEMEAQMKSTGAATENFSKANQGFFQSFGRRTAATVGSWMHGDFSGAQQKAVNAQMAGGEHGGDVQEGIKRRLDIGKKIAEAEEHEADMARRKSMGKVSRSEEIADRAERQKAALKLAFSESPEKSNADKATARATLNRRLAAIDSASDTERLQEEFDDWRHPAHKKKRDREKKKWEKFMKERGNKFLAGLHPAASAPGTDIDKPLNPLHKFNSLTNPNPSAGFRAQLAATEARESHSRGQLTKDEMSVLLKDLNAGIDRTFKQYWGGN